MPQFFRECERSEELAGEGCASREGVLALHLHLLLPAALPALLSLQAGQDGPAARTALANSTTEAATTNGKQPQYL